MLGRQRGGVRHERGSAGGSGVRRPSVSWSSSSHPIMPNLNCVFCLHDAPPPLLPLPPILFLFSHSLHVEPRHLDVYWQALAACGPSDWLLFLTLCIVLCVCVCMCVSVCVCTCAHRGGGVSLFSWRLKGLIFVAGLSDLRSLHARSMPVPTKWQRLMRATRPPWRVPATTGNMFFQIASW